METIKLKLLNDEIKILDETNKKFIEENNILVSKIKVSNNENSNLKNTIQKQIDEINQNIIDQEELEFLRLNLLYSSKCTRAAFKTGYKVGTPEYKACVLRRGKKLND
tara:strand:- start:563 stop:886 length:324 start_codon:yes stop_codon:yes gene_type:complete